MQRWDSIFSASTFLKTQDLEKTTQKWQVEMLAYENINQKSS